MLKFALLYMTDSSMLIYVYEWLHICAECVYLQGFPPASSDMLHWIFSDLSLGVHTLYMHVHCTKPPSVFVPHVYVINVQIKLIGEGTTWTLFSDVYDLQLHILARAIEELNLQGNLIRASRMCVLRAEMRLLKLDIRGKRGGVDAVFPSFLHVQSEQEKPYYTLPSGTD